MSAVIESGFTPLPESQVSALLAEARNGNFNARERLVSANTRLVGSIVRRFAMSGHESDDLFQIGCIGLLKAIDRFDTGYGVCFSTYAVPLIMGEIRRFLRDDRAISVSRSLKERAQKIEKKRHELRREWGVEPELWQLAAACGCTDEQALIAIEALRPPLSINETRCKNDGQGMSLSDTLAAPEETGESWAERWDLRRGMASLPPRLALILHGRYFEERTQKELAAQLGVSQVQISRLEKQALSMLRQIMTEPEIS